MDFVTVLAWFFVAATVACVALWSVVLLLLLVEMSISIHRLLKEKS